VCRIYSLEDIFQAPSKRKAPRVVTRIACSSSICHAMPCRDIASHRSAHNHPCLTALNLLHLAIRLPRVNLLARLLDLLEHSRVVERISGDDLSGLRLEGYVIGLDACKSRSVSRGRINVGEGGGAPSSFLRTRSTAPEQPPQLIAMLNL
jgi:hypothetical protein